MKNDTLIKMFRADSRNGCPVMKECDKPGGVLLTAGGAADAMEAAKEKQAIFRLGQKDLQAAAIDALTEAADGTHGIVCATLIAAAEILRKLETG